MVIPIPAGGAGGLFGQPLSGPAPPELRHRFSIIKKCVYAMCASMCGKFLVGLLLGQPLSFLSSSLNLLLNTVIGIFLLYDDENLKHVYNFMMNTCCSPCQEQCQGRAGMSCLLTFVFSNLITVVLDIFLNDVLQTIINGFGIIFDGKIQRPVDRIAFTLYIVSATVAFVAQTIGAWQGWEAHKEGQNIGSFSAPGDDPPASSSSWFGGGGGTEMGARPAAGFEAFSGSGNRLGSGN
mmetsp:Transcript_47063/g.102414  ORF Transcript_47063/g.102414 Transcript_47063/m.102414 type:complete len:237 (-) Transcript_47063:117-827(-)|eukprot:CAMPEP_0170601914 /NCGR_PEP_ID=MMETSP0224-20130122/18114_1 /TAXON_ID=285029 /ORGANISM="Togula jolla, Strain CCCM 725" /LENGTH=236 /DNA_ID=CAMNT_0010926723 /DNA_START=46 /DNA_END=756 /DNA_ORIENTATION=+